MRLLRSHLSPLERTARVVAHAFSRQCAAALISSIMTVSTAVALLAQPTADPAVVITSDLVNFYRAFDRARGLDSASRVRVFLEEYIRPGSPGMRDWALLRLAGWDQLATPLEAAGWRMASVGKAYQAPADDSARVALFRILTPLVETVAARNIAAATAAWPRFYAGIRPRVMALESSRLVRAKVTVGFAQLHSLYPARTLPPVYLLMGRLTSGGTVGRSGMLLGVEMSMHTPETPVDELTPVQRTMLSDRSSDGFAALVVHEAVHTLQPRDRINSLLSSSIREGVADFLASLSMWDWRIEDISYQAYGRAHEARVWREFQSAMARGEDSDHWLSNYGDTKNHGAADLGYFVGFRICEAYVSRAPDKAAAIRELIALRDPVAILRRSGYAGSPPASVMRR